jgi:hypothetical protein
MKPLAYGQDFLSRLAVMWCWSCWFAMNGAQPVGIVLPNVCEDFEGIDPCWLLGRTNTDLWPVYDPEVTTVW